MLSLMATKSVAHFSAAPKPDNPSEWIVREDGQEVAAGMTETTARFLAQSANAQRARAMARIPIFINNAQHRLN